MHLSAPRGWWLCSLVIADYPPFYYYAMGDIQGVAVDMIDELFQRMDLEADIEMFPLPRALGFLEKGERDGIMILIKTPERAQYLEYTVPVMSVRGLIWSAADRHDGPVEFGRLEDLRQHRAGVTRGYSYGHEFDQILKSMKVDVSNADILNFRKLISHRVDIFPANEIVARGLIKIYPELQGKVTASKNSFIEWVLHMAVSKKSPLASRLAEINAILAGMKASGFVDQAIKRHTQ